MSNESFNHLISNFSTLDQQTYEVIDNSCVAIDTTSNRIGINILDPLYSIHIVGNDEYICVSNIIVTKLINVPLNTANGNGLETNQIYRDANGFLKINI
tara:strand:+ start:103 stop:399 length:297 start_codon:yes stop_codon:yes gene_type:complete